MAKKYVCKNPACVLGTPVSLGRFTGGITKEQVHLLTGKPADLLEKGVDYGEGFCPNCADKGEEWDPVKAQKQALADAKAAYEAQVAAIKEGVA